MSFNVWSPQGQLTGLTAKSNPSVIYEGNPQILGGPNVFKMWCCPINNGGGLYYYESADGLTSWTAHPSNPIQAADTLTTVFHIGSTYYLYEGNGSINVHTSADGITWSAGSQILTVGGVGVWDHLGVFQLQIVPGTPGYGTGTGETYYGYYEGNGAGGSALGLVTATNLSGPWTKDAGNPIIAVPIAPGTFQKVGSTYYLWAPGGSGVIGVPGLRRWSATAPNGPWTIFQYGGTNVTVNYPVLVADINSGDITKGSSPQDPSILEVNGSCYIYSTKTKNPGGIQQGINASVATGTTLAQLVAGLEGVVGFPIPVLTVNLNTLASDNFTRANVNPIGGNWSPINAGNTCQIASNFMEPSAISQSADSYWNALTWPNDQWSQITMQAETGSNIGPEVRMHSTGTFTSYLVQMSAGNLGASVTLQMLSVINGATNTLSSYTTGFVTSVGDRLMLCISGQNLLLYYNGGPLFAGTDANIAAGSAGARLFAVTAVANARISAWSGGGFQAVPGTLAGNAGSMRLRRRKRPYAI